MDVNRRNLLGNRGRRSKRPHGILLRNACTTTGKEKESAKKSERGQEGGGG